MSEVAEAPTSLPRRQARSRITHGRLLDAAVACLVERGYAGTTTTEVCARAGVSQGALFKHFPSKAALLAATVEHLYAGLVADYRSAFAALSESTSPVRAAAELLQQTFGRPVLHASLELMVASRTDARLREALAPVQLVHRENLLRAAEELFPNAIRHPSFESTVDLLLSALQGSAVSALAVPDEAAASRLVDHLVEIASPVFDGGLGGKPSSEPGGEN